MKKPSLPRLLTQKLYKTGQTRGADDDVIFQNRVLRNSTVLIPYDMLLTGNSMNLLSVPYENGFIVLISPEQFFGINRAQTLNIMQLYKLYLGANALIFYTQRSEYTKYPPQNLLNASEPFSRVFPLGGEYIARISATTSEPKINFGYNISASKGAGIRLYEYCGKNIIELTRYQLEALYWMCEDSVIASIENGMTEIDALNRKAYALSTATSLQLLDLNQLKNSRCIDSNSFTVCPLCLKKLSARGFYTKVEQQTFRQVHDLTITEINLFHLNELRDWEFNHKPYNLSWGHHHCNMVVKDNGIFETILWMQDVINRNNSN